MSELPTRPLSAEPLVGRAVAHTSLWLSQEDPGTEATRRREADKWLRQARQALKDGKLDLAGYYLDRAEQLNAKYDSMLAKIGDTPEKLRKELADLKAQTGPAGPAATRRGPAPATNAPVADPFPVAAAPPAAVPAAAPGAAPRTAGPVPAVPPAIFDEGAGPLKRLPSPDQVGPATKEEALRLAALARAALDRGDLPSAKGFAEKAQSLKIPDQAFAPGEVRPWQVLLEVESAMNRRAYTAQAANFAEVVPAGDRRTFPVAQGIYLQGQDGSRNMPAQALEPAPAQGPPVEVPPSQGLELYRQGLRALEQQDIEGAVQLFSDAWRFERELDPATRQQLKDKLVLLRNAANPPAPNPGARPSPLEEVDAQQQLLGSKLWREITAEEQIAIKQSESDPKGALQRLKDMRQRVSSAELDETGRKRLLTLVDRRILELEHYIEQNRAEIELRERNAAIEKQIDDGRQQTAEVQQKIAELVDQFNQLLDERRYAEAEVIAKQANELDAESPVVQNLMWKSRFVRRIAEQESIRGRGEEGFFAALQSVQDSSTPFNDANPISFGDVKNWSELSKVRGERMASARQQLLPSEMKIRQALKQEVEVHFDNRPLAEVIETLGSLGDVNVFLDPQGMAAERVTSDTPVTINLTQPITLQSALNLILEPLRLTFVIKNEVLQITSEQMQNSTIYPVTYYVGDLVTPIPNFIPDYSTGVAGTSAAMREAYQNMGYGLVAPTSGGAPLRLAGLEGEGGANTGSVLAQMLSSGSAAHRTSPVPRPNLVTGPNGLGGATLDDFQPLIDLIQSTIAPATWADTQGGPGTIEPFLTNLSLVISQTQEIHEQIADLLEQLRNMQDLQVTIEVRFITLRDDFFERIGVDFDFNIDDNVGSLPPEDGGNTVVVGLDPAGQFTQNLDLQFAQDSFGIGIPPFGNFDAANAASFGFAILSDIEVFLLLQAAQADRRSNVLQAPKVTLFNGQLASVVDAVQRPFVIGLIPVVGDFAAAHQPVVAVLNEGTTLSVQAVVSSDRRFVRLTLVPYFSRIDRVEEFTFIGRTSSDSGTNVIDPDGKTTGQKNNVKNETEGSTVQLPSLAVTSVSTTVSVPDGGTILLGGIKRLREGRNEAGVPMLSKLPYVNRLFRNVGIGRETESLMMMVTPRIIIQQEEEEKMGLRAAP